jgi:hypothetical protein
MLSQKAEMLALSNQCLTPAAPYCRARGVREAVPFEL